ncbi:MAG: hypothetical protein MUO63_22965 [Desulfobulbaceae bacterium]|nr:hypothetical protein [Desulfobulbaceae bacterium]
MINVKLWAECQYGVLAEFVHHLAHYRVLSEICAATSEKSEFWISTIDAHILRAIIDWCMVFGTDSNEIHWKKVVPDPDEQKSFRAYLSKNAGMNKSQWKSYWQSMTDFRNEYAAHKRVQGTYPPVPMMEMALQVVFAYDDWYRSVVEASFEEPSLRDRYNRVIRTSEGPLKRAVSQGPWLNEEYEGHPPHSEQ